VQDSFDQEDKFLIVNEGIRTLIIIFDLQQYCQIRILSINLYWSSCLMLSFFFKKKIGIYIKVMQLQILDILTNLKLTRTRKRVSFAN